MSAAASKSSSSNSSSSSSRGTASTGSSPSAQLIRLAEMDNLELFAAKALAYIDDLPDPMVPTYHVMPRSRGNDMLSWDKKLPRPRGTPKSQKDKFELHVQIQDIGDGFARIGAIGDGNCMVHSMFTAVSPTYRAQGLEVRQAIADRFRDVLAVRIDDLRALADDIYREQGGAEAFYDAFENLENSADRTEIDMELGPVIGQLYGFNYIAARLDDDLNMLPVRQSLIGRRPDLPTVFIHYTGGATEGGAGFSAKNFGGQGHYEVIVRPVVASGGGAGRRATTASRGGVLPASGSVILDEVHTTFMFAEADLAGVLAKFGNLNAAVEMSPTTKATFLASVERKRAEGKELSPATLRTLAALEKKAAIKKSSSSRKSSSTSAGGSNVSPRTLAAILALEGKKSTSARRSTRKASPPKPRGGAGAPTPARRSERLRATTQKKKKTSSSRSGSNISPGTLEAILAMEAMNLKGGVPNLE